MKPFNLEKALAGEFCQTRDGRKARVIFNEKELHPGSSQPILGFITTADGAWFSNLRRWNIDGIHSYYATPHALDLVGMWEEPQPKVNIMGLPSPLLKVEDGERVWCWIDYNGSYRTLEFTFEQSSTSDKCKLESGLIFATEEDAQAWLDAMKGARR